MFLKLMLKGYVLKNFGDMKHIGLQILESKCGYCPYIKC